MIMKPCFKASFAVVLSTLSFATESTALEKRSAPATDRVSEWNAGSDCLLRYYNICTGWIWVWSGWPDDSRLGVVFDGGSCADDTALLSSTVFVATGVPPGYGFTGTIDVHAIDANLCPTGAPIASQPFVPSSGFQLVVWPGVPVPDDFAIVVTVQTPEQSGVFPGSFGTDHPAAGPTGPQACGVCYPANRPNRSFAYGSASSPICPGSVFNDGLCDAQLVWDATVIPSGIAVQSSSWGSIKSLYR
jgi:hypothetical protein